jgi:hypothetical protein
LQENDSRPLFLTRLEDAGCADVVGVGSGSIAPAETRPARNGPMSRQRMPLNSAGFTCWVKTMPLDSSRKTQVMTVLAAEGMSFRMDR